MKHGFFRSPVAFLPLSVFHPCFIRGSKKGCRDFPPERFRGYRPRQPPRLFPGFSGAWADRVRCPLGSGRQGRAPGLHRADYFRAVTLGADPPATNTTRHPLLLLRLSGVLLLRLDDNRFLGSLLFQDAPRNTRAVRPPSHFRHGARPKRARPTAENQKSFVRALRARKGKRVKG
jgi:hypothetical protein